MQKAIAIYLMKLEEKNCQIRDNTFVIPISKYSKHYLVQHDVQISSDDFCTLKWKLFGNWEFIERQYENTIYRKLNILKHHSKRQETF